MLSVYGPCAITAAMRASAAASVRTCPPEYELPQQHNAVGVDPIQATCPLDHGAVVVELPGDVEQLTGLTCRIAEMTVVEHDDDESRIAECLGVPGQPVLPCPCKAVRHDHAGRVALCRVGPVHVGCKLLAVAGNPHIVSHSVDYAPELQPSRPLLELWFVDSPGALVAGTRRAAETIAHSNWG